MKLEAILLFMALYFASFLLFVASGGVRNPSGEITVCGIVITTSDDSGNIISIKLMAEDTDEYNVILNEIGMKLGEEMNKRWIKATGILYKKGKDYWLEVDSYSKADEGLTHERDILLDRLFKMA